jgi:hypothetical protein
LYTQRRRRFWKNINKREKEKKKELVREKKKKPKTVFFFTPSLVHPTILKQEKTMSSFLHHLPKRPCGHPKLKPPSLNTKLPSPFHGLHKLFSTQPTVHTPFQTTLNEQPPF